MSRLDIFAPDVRNNPYPHYAELRRSAPVTPIEPGGIWAVSRHEDCITVLRTPEIFSSRGLATAAIQPWLPKNPVADSFLLMDAPRHGKLRALVANAFGTRVIPRVEPICREVAAAFAARAPGGGEIDICEEISSTIPAAVVAALCGFDPALSSRFRGWSDDIAAVNPGTPEEARPRIVASVAELDRYLREVISARRIERRDDLVSDLIDAEVDGQHLSEDELVSFFFLLVVAGYETTSHLITNALRLLADRPDLLARLRGEPALIPAFIEEVLRFDPPVHGTLRVAVADTELAGTRVAAGTPVLVLLASALRDERHFEDPDRFDLDRPHRGPSLAFGHGPHYCLGAALARTEARIALEEILPRIRGVRVTRPPTWNLAVTVRGALRCGMVFDAASGDQDGTLVGAIGA